MQKDSLKIISGAQTGVDRAALDAALAFGVPCGGWVPTGRLDEGGIIPAHYPVEEMENGSFRQRTIQNLVDADGTLIIYFGDLDGGTEQTAHHCIKRQRPTAWLTALRSALSALQSSPWTSSAPATCAA